MTWAAAISALNTIMATAAPDHTRMAGEPANPVRKTIAWWYEGTTDNPLIGETLTDHPYGEIVTVRAYWPVATRATNPAETLETDVRTVSRALVAGLMAARSLGGNSEVLTINDVSTGWQVQDGNWCRVLTVPIVIGVTDSEPISR